MTATETSRGTLGIPEARAAMPPTSEADVDAALETLRDHRKAWVDLDVDGRIALLGELLATALAAADAWALRAAEAKGIDRDSPNVGEDYGSGPYQLLRNLALLKVTLEQIRDHGRPLLPDVSVRPDGRVTIQVFPADRLDALFYRGFTADVWIKPGVPLADVERDLARVYRPGGKDGGGTALVLGAGNVSSIGPMDALYKLFVHDRVVLLKMNPVNEHAGPHIAEAFEPLIRDGFLRIVYGGADVGAYVTGHDLVDELHLTGSDKTHDAIVFGTGEEGARRKAERDPKLTKPFTSELGNVSPVIVVPGPWSDADLAYHGESIASMLTNNAGFNCVAARMVVQHASWAKRRALLDEIRGALRAAEERVPYYPGAVERWQAFTEGHEQSECFGRIGPDRVPFTLIPDLDPTVEDDIAFTTEAFAGVMGEVALDAPRSVPEYLAMAVRFCNERLWGNLAATLVVHPASLRDPGIAAAVEQAIEDLRYGTVVVNHWTGSAGYGLVSTPWGAYPGNDITDIQSGQGWVHNTTMIADEHIEKTVVRGPFRTPTKPPWFLSHRGLPAIAPRMARLTATGDLSVLPALLWHALRG